MLPPIHLALLRTAALVASFSDALAVIEKAYKGNIPPYISFITGPSKTADIERKFLPVPVLYRVITYEPAK